MPIKVHRDDVNRVRQLKIGNRAMSAKDLIEFLSTLPEDAVFVCGQSYDKKNTQLFFQSKSFEIVSSDMEVPEFEIGLDIETSKKVFKEGKSFDDLLAGL